MSVWNRLFDVSATNEPSDRLLDEAVSGLRAEASVEQLSPKSRAFIVEEFISGNGAPATSGLRHVMRLALGVVPVVIAAVLVVAVGSRWKSSGPDWVKVEKVDGEVVFKLDDSGSHRVLASTDAQHFAGARELRTVDGEILVEAAEEPKLVFYRVD